MKILIIAIGLIVVFIIALQLLVPISQIKSKSDLPIQGKAADFVGISNWLNSNPLTVNELKGKVLLVDFWTYSCINCIRTLPYLKNWHEKYSDKGLVIIGIHTPEFEFEKDTNNVKAALEKYGIKYPVAQDNQYQTWRAYKNNYWPRKYLVDINGSIRYDHIGEGGYEETEKAIQELLKERGSLETINMTKINQETDLTQIASPEIYLGYEFARVPLGNKEGFSTKNIVDYGEFNTTSIKLPNTVYLSGKWESKNDRIISTEKSKLFLVYKANKVNIVAGGKSEIKILVDGKTLDNNSSGQDSQNSAAQINEQRLYNIVSSKDYEPHLLEIDAEKGFELYTFTFG